MTREHPFLLNFFASRDVFRLKGAARGLLLTRLYKSMRISLFHKREQLNFIEIIFSLISQTLPKAERKMTGKLFVMTIHNKKLTQSKITHFKMDKCTGKSHHTYKYLQYE